MSLALSLRDVVRTHAAGRAVTRVTVEIGSLAGVSREAFAFSAGVVFREAFGPGVAVDLTGRPGEFTCACGMVYTGDDPLAPCPACGGFDRRVTDGLDLVLQAIEVEDTTQGD